MTDVHVRMDGSQGILHLDGAASVAEVRRRAERMVRRLTGRSRQADHVLTHDNGAQLVIWTGHRRYNGPKLHTMPHLRPIRFWSGVFGPDRPDPDLQFSPQHRMLLKGRAAQALFSVDAVLAAAKDLVNDLTVTIDCAVQEGTSVHVLLERHNVFWADGLESESFHRANAALDKVDPLQREDLLDQLPKLMRNPHS